MTRHTDRPPFTVLNAFDGAESAVEICHQRNVFFPANLCQLSEQIVFQGRMPGADLRVVIRHADVAPGVERNVIRAAFFDFIREVFDVKILADVRVFILRVIVVKQCILNFVHV